MIAAGLLISVLALATFGGTGLDQTFTIHRRTLASLGLGVLLLVLNHDWLLLAFWIVLCLNALRAPLPAMRLSRMEAAVMLYGVYMVASAAMTEAGIYSLLIAFGLLSPLGAGLWYLGDKEFCQKQINHAEGFMVVSIAACCALAFLDSWYWLLLGLPALRVIQWTRYGHMGQAALWLWHLGLLALLLWRPWLGISLLVLYVGVLCWLAWRLRTERCGIDAGRVRIWWLFFHIQFLLPSKPPAAEAHWLTRVNSSAWTKRLFGMGWQSWAAWADDLARLEEQRGMTDVGFFLHPHNEYVHVLFEHGAVGLGLFLAWLGMLLWHAASAGPLGTALLFPAVAIGSVAMTSFPWGPPDHLGFGSMGLTTLSLIILVMLGAV